MTLKAYFDGSGYSKDPNSGHLTLAGYIGIDDAWSEFNVAWRNMLARHGCAYMHMIEAKHLDKEFAIQKGWTEAKVSAVIEDLISSCFAEIGWHKYRDKFCGVSCTIDLTDYRRVCAEFPGFEKRKSPESICVDCVVTVALSMLPADDSSETGKMGHVELIFDRNEAFLHKINQPWLEHKKRSEILRHIASICTADMRNVPGLQAADVLAWYANYSHREGDSFWYLVSGTMSPSHSFSLDYPSLVRRYKSLLSAPLDTPP